MKTRTPIHARPTLVFPYERVDGRQRRKFRVVTRRRPKEGLAAFRRRHQRKVERLLHRSNRGRPDHAAIEIRPV